MVLPNISGEDQRSGFCIVYKLTIEYYVVRPIDTMVDTSKSVTLALNVVSL